VTHRLTLDLCCASRLFSRRSYDNAEIKRCVSMSAKRLCSLLCLLPISSHQLSGRAALIKLSSSASSSSSSSAAAAAAAAARQGALNRRLWGNGRALYPNFSPLRLLSKSYVLATRWNRRALFHSRRTYIHVCILYIFRATAEPPGIRRRLNITCPPPSDSCPSDGVPSCRLSTRRHRASWHRALSYFPSSPCPTQLSTQPTSSSVARRWAAPETAPVANKLRSLALLLRSLLQSFTNSSSASSRAHPEPFLGIPAETAAPRTNHGAGVGSPARK
jgi:hypothetical protein